MKASFWRARTLLAGAVFILGGCSGTDGTSADGGAGGGTGSGSTAASSTTGSGSTGSGGSTSSGTTTGSGGGGGGCIDQCPAPHGGVDYACKSRFMYGVNYAWEVFAGDFGGISPWQNPGILANATVHAQQLADMRAHGASVIRWWVFPDFRGDGITFDGNENPTGLGGTVVADLEKALELADAADVYLMLCLFSFDAFRPSADIAGIWTPGITPMVTTAAKRSMLMENVVRPFAKAAEASPYKNRLIAWDIINEPEWAMQGPSPYGNEDYGADPQLDPVTHAQMETFVADTIQVLRAESHALVTVGGAAMKWSKAWSAVDVDFYQFHIYDWVDQYWPYTGSPADYGVSDKPVVMGEFPSAGLSSASYAQILASWYDNGYAGALGWQYIEATPQELDDMKAFADGQPCETSY